MLSFEEWAKQVPESLRRDPLWRSLTYRKALYLYELTWESIQQWPRQPGVFALADQLLRSLGSICANLEEGWGRGFGADRNRFLRMALGSAREAKGWYFRARHLLGDEILEARLALLDSIIGLLVSKLQRQRRHSTQR